MLRTGYSIGGKLGFPIHICVIAVIDRRGRKRVFSEPNAGLSAARGQEWWLVCMRQN
jgi:hypothetical protein